MLDLILGGVPGAAEGEGDAHPRRGLGLGFWVPVLREGVGTGPVHLLTHILAARAAQELSHVGKDPSSTQMDK